ncbi:unnamed protein product, partial [Polarella glacialis]
MWEHQAVVSLATGSAMVGALCGIIEAQRIPLAIACHIFTIKIESTVRFGRWLWGATPEALTSLDAAYGKWAQQLLGADAWRNTAMCRSELGWALSGSGRAIYDMAMKRTSFWAQAETTLAGKSFVAAHLSDGNTWAKRSRALLEQWEVQDWPAWLATRSSSTKYCTYVKGALAATCMRDWTPAVQKHVRPIPYLSLTTGPTTMLNDALRLRLAWAVLVGHRELIRLRCGLLRLSHVARKRSRIRARTREVAKAGLYGPGNVLGAAELAELVAAALRMLRDRYAPEEYLRNIRTVHGGSHRLKDRYGGFEFLSRGLLGKSYRCKSRLTREEHVCRQVRKDKLLSPADLIRSEAEVLRSLEHPNFPQVIETFEDFNNIYIVLEPVETMEFVQLLCSYQDTLDAFVNRLRLWLVALAALNMAIPCAADVMCDVKMSAREVMLVDPAEGDEVYTASTLEVECSDVYMEDGEMSATPWDLYMQKCASVGYGERFYNETAKSCQSCPQDLSELPQSLSAQLQGGNMYCQFTGSKCMCSDGMTAAFVAPGVTRCAAADTNCLDYLPMSQMNYNLENPAVVPPALTCTGLPPFAASDINLIFMPQVAKDPLFECLRRLFAEAVENREDILADWESRRANNRMMVLFMNTQTYQGIEMVVGPSMQQIQSNCNVTLNVFVDTQGTGLNDNVPIAGSLLPIYSPRCVADDMKAISVSLQNDLDLLTTSGFSNVSCVDKMEEMMGRKLSSPMGPVASVSGPEVLQSWDKLQALAEKSAAAKKEKAPPRVHTGLGR